MIQSRFSHFSHHRGNQRGVALFVVIIFVMLSMLLALWASRTSLFGEMIVGNDADYQRAFEAAQALMQDAELDIRGENANGTACTPDTTDNKVCRNSGVPQIPLAEAEVAPLLSELANKTYQCSHGLCVKHTQKQDFWNIPSSVTNQGFNLAQMTGTNTSDGSPVGARYGMYTGAQLGSTGNANPILADRSSATSGGWYWIEVLKYDESSRTSGLIVAQNGGVSTANNNYLSANLVPNVVYRITALAYGRKTGMPPVVIQETYVRQKTKDI